MDKTVRIMGFLAVSQLLAACLTAQEAAPRGPFAGGAQGERQRSVVNRRGGGEMREREGLGRDTMFFRMVMDPRTATEIGLKAEVAAAMRAEMTKVQEKQIDLQAELRKLMLRQTDLVAGLLANREKDSAEALELVEEMGKVRTEIAKLAIERILVVRQHMTDEQIAGARRTMAERMKRRVGEVRARRGGGEETDAGVGRGER